MGENKVGGVTCWSGDKREGPLSNDGGLNPLSSAEGERRDLEGFSSILLALSGLPISIVGVDILFGVEILVGDCKGGVTL